MVPAVCKANKNKKTDYKNNSFIILCDRFSNKAFNFNLSYVFFYSHLAREKYAVHKTNVSHIHSECSTVHKRELFLLKIRL
jgi:hypothetical protein